MLGPAPEGFPSPTHMQMCQQKLHPGSGCLTVRIQMDGPVRVVQISDIQQRVSIEWKISLHFFVVPTFTI